MSLPLAIPEADGFAIAPLQGCPPDLSGLTEKRVRILRLLSEHGFMTMREISEVLRDRSSAYTALNVLRVLDLAEEFPTGLLPKKATCLTPKGWETLKGLGLLRARRLWRREEYSAPTFFHTLAGLRCRIILEKLPQVSGWIPDSLLPRTKDERCADAEFDFTGSTSKKTARVALEVELTLKSPDRRKAMLSQLDAREDIYRVLWVTRGEIVARFIREDIQATGLRNPGKHFFADIDGLFTQREKANWYDLAGKAVNK